MKFQVQALPTMTATAAITVKEPQLQKAVKERNLQRKINRILFTAVLPKRYKRNYLMELIIISSKKSTSSQAIALPGGQEIQVPQPVAFASPEAYAHSCTFS